MYTIQYADVYNPFYNISFDLFMDYLYIVHLWYCGFSILVMYVLNDQRNKHFNDLYIGEVGAYPHTEACPHTLLFVHRVTSGLWNRAKRHRLTPKSTTWIYFLIEVNK